MKVCLISNQIAAWGKIGGFGTATRALGRALVRHGVEVSAVIPRRSGEGQGPLETVDGITVYGVPALEVMTSGAIFRDIDADLYQSQEPTIASYWAQRAVPHRSHVITCRDPRGWREHLVELRHTNFRRRLLFPLTYLYEASPWVKQAVRRADAVLTPAPTELHPRIHRLYGSGVEPQFVPYPVDLPAAEPRKAERPLILFVGRFDHRKRPELFLDLATQFPHLDFAAVGRAHDAAYDCHLRDRYGGIPNLQLPGFVPRFGQPGILDYYERAWILVNTAAREGLPYTFMEAAAFGVAILSGVDPEGFASRFGRHAQDGDFAAALLWLLERDRWRGLGLSGAAHVAATWSEEASVRRHLEVYLRLGCPVPSLPGVGQP